MRLIALLTTATIALATEDAAPTRPPLRIVTTEQREPFAEEKTELQEMRNKDVIVWAKALLASQHMWYHVGNVSECVAQLCFVASPILSACSAAMGDTKVALGASIVGASGVGLGKFSKYAHRESSERGASANNILNREGIPIIQVMQTSASSPS